MVSSTEREVKYFRTVSSTEREVKYFMFFEISFKYTRNSTGRSTDIAEHHSLYAIYQDCHLKFVQTGSSQ